MKTLSCIVLFTALPIGLIAQVGSDIAPPRKRMETVDLARTLLTTKPVDISMGEIKQKDPFNPMRSVVSPKPEQPVAVKAAGADDRDILINLAEAVTPSGTMQLGDIQFLLFGQKKLKVGDSIPLMFQGAPYEVEIIGVERTSYTLRLNKEEITRPIKTVNKP